MIEALLKNAKEIRDKAIASNAIIEKQYKNSQIFKDQTQKEANNAKEKREKVTKELKIALAQKDKAVKDAQVSSKAYNMAVRDSQIANDEYISAVKDANIAKEALIIADSNLKKANEELVKAKKNKVGEKAVLNDYNIAVKSAKVALDQKLAIDNDVILSKNTRDKADAYIKNMKGTIDNADKNVLNIQLIINKLVETEKALKEKKLNADRSAKVALDKAFADKVILDKNNSDIGKAKDNVDKFTNDKLNIDKTIQNLNMKLL